MQNVHVLVGILCLMLIQACTSGTMSTSSPVASDSDVSEVLAESSVQVRDPVDTVFVPEGFLVIGINESAGFLILSDQVSPGVRIQYLDARESQFVETGFVPKVAVRLHSELGHAVFGHRPVLDRRGNPISTDEIYPTTGYAVVTDGEVTESRLAEPIAVTDGFLIPETEQLVLTDNSLKSSGLVFLDAREVASGIEAVRLSRLWLDDAPYDIERVSWRHLAISYTNNSRIELFDYYSFDTVSFVEQFDFEPSALVAPIDTDRGIFAIYNFGPRYSRREASRTRIGFYSIEARKGGYYEAEWLDPRGFMGFGPEFNFSSDKQRSVKTPVSHWGYIKPIVGYEHPILLYGFGPHVGALKLPVTEVYGGLNPEHVTSYFLEGPEATRIDVDDHSQHVYLSVPEEGMILAIDKEYFVN